MKHETNVDWINRCRRTMSFQRGEKNSFCFYFSVHFRRREKTRNTFQGKKNLSKEETMNGGHSHMQDTQHVKNWFDEQRKATARRYFQIHFQLQWLTDPKLNIHSNKLNPFVPTNHSAYGCVNIDPITLRVVCRVDTPIRRTTNAKDRESTTMVRTKRIVERSDSLKTNDGFSRNRFGVELTGDTFVVGHGHRLFR